MVAVEHVQVAAFATGEKQVGMGAGLVREEQGAAGAEIIVA
jgi:hypothetical protein